MRAPPDGYTLLLVAPANAINATLYDNLNFNFIRDIAPVASIIRVPFVMVVNPSFPAKTVPEFIAYAKANPGKVNMASAGNRTATHVAGELFKMMAGVNMVHVPYRGGGPRVTDLLGGQVQVYFSPMPASIEYIKAGKLRAIGGDHRDALGSAAGHADGGRVRAGLRGERLVRHWRTQGTPAEIVDKLNNEINAGLADPKSRRGSPIWAAVIAGSPSDFGSSRRGNREVGQGDPGGQHQAGVTRCPGRYSVTCRSAECVPMTVVGSYGPLVAPRMSASAGYRRGR